MLMPSLHFALLDAAVSDCYHLRARHWWGILLPDSSPVRLASHQITQPKPWSNSSVIFDSGSLEKVEFQSRLCEGLEAKSMATLQKDNRIG
jgi:hypothetical protein